MPTLLRELMSVLRDWGWVIVVTGLVLLVSDLLLFWKKGKLRIIDIVGASTLGGALVYLVWLVKNMPTTPIELIVNCGVAYLFLMGTSISNLLSLLKKEKKSIWGQLRLGFFIGALFLMSCWAFVFGILGLEWLNQIIKQG